MSEVTYVKVSKTGFKSRQSDCRTLNFLYKTIRCKANRCSILQPSRAGTEADVFYIPMKRMKQGR